MAKRTVGRRTDPEEEEGRHGLDVERVGHIGLLLRLDLEEEDGRVLGRERRDDLQASRDKGESKVSLAQAEDESEGKEVAGRLFRLRPPSDRLARAGKLDSYELLLGSRGVVPNVKPSTAGSRPAPVRLVALPQGGAPSPPSQTLRRRPEENR